MTELDLYKFIQKNNIEHHEYNGEHLIFVNFSDLKELTELLGEGFFDDGGHEVTMQKGYIAIELDSICEYFDIEIKNIF